MNYNSENAMLCYDREADDMYHAFEVPIWRYVPRVLWVGERWVAQPLKTTCHWPVGGAC